MMSEHNPLGLGRLSGCIDYRCDLSGGYPQEIYPSPRCRGGMRFRCIEVMSSRLLQRRHSAAAFTAASVIRLWKTIFAPESYRRFCISSAPNWESMGTAIPPQSGLTDMRNTIRVRFSAMIAARSPFSSPYHQRRGCGRHLPGQTLYR